MDWNKGACRSYTYNKATKQCFLSHASQKALGRSVLENLGKDLSSGEIDDCINCKSFLKFLQLITAFFSQVGMSRKKFKTERQINETLQRQYSIEKKQKDGLCQKHYGRL